MYKFENGTMNMVVDFSDRSQVDITNPDTYKDILRAHYVTITGIIIVDGEKYFRVQSWGEVYYLKYSEMFGAENCVYLAE